MSTVFTMRKRKLFQPLKKAKLTAEQKHAQNARGSELEARIDAVADYINRETKSIAKEYNKYVTSRAPVSIAKPFEISFLRPR